MKTLKDIQNTLTKELPLLKAQYQVKSLGIFGSYVRHEQHEKSDVDILVDYETPPSLLKVIALENYLTDLLEVKVDLVMKSSLKKRIGAQILSETLPI